MRNTFFEYRYGMGPKEGELIAAPRNETGSSTVHRAKFLNEFVALVPKDICHFGKRLMVIEDKPDNKGVVLHFKDETTAEADCIIGADGVHSIARAYILGKDHPALNPVFTGSVAYRGRPSLAACKLQILRYFRLDSNAESRRRHR
jgi:salicylate hydroxylase